VVLKKAFSQGWDRDRIKRKGARQGQDELGIQLRGDRGRLGFAVGDTTANLTAPFSVGNAPATTPEIIGNTTDTTSY
jgi:hypothetical protein